MEGLISDTSSITLGLAITLITSIAGFVWQTAKQSSRIEELGRDIENMSKKIDTMQNEQEKIKTDNTHISERMVRIETKLDIIIESFKK